MVLYSKVVIDGVTVRDDTTTDQFVISKWEYEKSDADPMGDLEIECISTITSLVDLENGKVVEVYSSEDNISFTRLFYGYIDSVIPNGVTINVICENELKDLVKKNVNKVYDSTIDPSAGRISAIIEDLITVQGGLTASVQDSGTTQLIEEFKCINTDIYERVKALVDALNWTLYYNAVTRTVHVEPRGFEESGVTLQTSQNILSVPKWSYDTSHLINDLRVDGATSQTILTETGQIGVTPGYIIDYIELQKTPDSVELLIDASNPPTTQKIGGSKDASTGNYYWTDKENKKIIPVSAFVNNDYAIINYMWSAPAPIHMINQDSITKYGLSATTIELSDVTSVADAESRAATILSKRSIPFITVDCIYLSSVKLLVGQLVNVQDNINVINNNGTYMIEKINYVYPSAADEIVVGDKIWRTTDWQESVETRLKRIEEEFVRNQDLILELRDITNDGNTNFLKPKNRFFKVRTRDTTDDSLWDKAGLAWDTPPFIWQDDYTFEEVDAIVLQGENIYEETFYDNEFEDKAGTGTWTTSGLNFD